MANTANTANTATATITAPALTMGEVKKMFPLCFNTTIQASLEAMDDKDAARLNVARAIAGAALYIGVSGDDTAMRQARAYVDAKKNGIAKTRRTNALSIVTIQNRALKTATDDDLKAYVDSIIAGAVAALTPPPVNRATKTTAAPVAGAVDAPAPVAGTAPAVVAAPAVGDYAAPVAAIIAAIQAGLLPAPLLAQLRAAMIDAPAPAPVAGDVAAPAPF